VVARQYWQILFWKAPVLTLSTPILSDVSSAAFVPLGIPSDKHLDIICSPRVADGHGLNKI
jgi:hypothetical protein